MRLAAAFPIGPLIAGSLMLALLGAPARAATDHAKLAAEIAAEHELDAAAVQAVLDQAEYRQGIIDAISRPAEAKPWKAYRPIFMNPQRIEGGRAFLAEHSEALARVEADTGVPASLIVAIIGVETNYGKQIGSHRVIDALYTLGVHYPPRQPFFRSELSHLFALARDEKLDLPALKGSYAGAMGWGQFMPSSYRNFAVDGDGDGRRDLWSSPADIFASIANYFVAHGWQPGQPVAVPARLDAASGPFKPESLEAIFALADLAERGYAPALPLEQDLPASVLNLDGEAGAEYWISFKNFWVISRYNRSPLYSLAVYQLSQTLGAPSVSGEATSGSAATAP